jgi:hypothetical protein
LHTAQWLLGSNSIPGTVDETHGTVAGNGSIPAGVYTVQMPVTDRCGNSGVATENGALDELIVAYDPSAPFVVGGGRFDSPAGALASDPSSAGPAGFGFVSRTRGGPVAPTGEAGFYFQFGSLRFQSASYDALTLSAGTAIYRGAGTVNGAGGFAFLLSVVDGVAGDGVDRFRIRITRNATSSVVYDNEPGAADMAAATTAISAGAIEVQGARLVATTRAAEVAGGPATSIPVAFALAPNAPNPFAGSTGLHFDLPEASAVSLTVYDVLGRRVASVVDATLPAGRHLSTWAVRGDRGGRVGPGVYVVRMEAKPVSGHRTFTTQRKVVVLP